MPTTTPAQNKAIMIEVMDTLFNKRDPDAAARFFSPDYIQRSTAVPPGRDGILNFIRGFPGELGYEIQSIIAEGDLVFIHARISGIAEKKTISVDIIRFENGLLKEHWDVLQEEADERSTKCGLPMFGDTFPA